MKQETRKTNRRLIVNVALTLFALLTLTMAIIAWFSSNHTAQLETLTMYVDQSTFEFDEVTDRLPLPCATKIADEEITAALFNTESSLSRVYGVRTEGDQALSLIASPQNAVGSPNAGLLAYVCDSVTPTDDYAEVTGKLEEKLGDDRSNWTYDNMKNALETINRRRVGELSDDGNSTQVRVLYWVEYDRVSAQLNSSGDTYWENNYAVRLEFHLAGGGIS